MKVELHKLNAMSETEAYAIQDLWQLDMNSRWRLYRWQRYFIWGLSSKGVRDCQSSNTFLQAKVFYSYMFSLLSEQTFSCKIFAFTPPALAGQCCHLHCVRWGLSTDASHVFHKGLNWIHLELLDHCSVLLSVGTNGSFLSGFGCRPIRDLFDGRFFSTNSSTRQQLKGWQNWGCKKISAFWRRPKLWGWQLQVCSIWGASYCCTASSNS